jgi:hypothetical protein
MTRGYWRVEAARLARLGPRVEPLALEPAIVEREGLPDDAARRTLLDPDRHLVTGPGDAYDLVFHVPLDRHDARFFLDATGYYYEWMRGEWLDERDPLRLALFRYWPRALLRRLAPEFKAREAHMEEMFGQPLWEGRVSPRTAAPRPPERGGARARAAGLLLAGTLGLGACHAAPAPGQPRLHGVEVEARHPAMAANPVRGELLAASDDSVWILVHGDPPALVASPLAGLDLRAPGGQRLRPFCWATFAGLGTGAGMTAACMMYEADAGCVLMVPVMLIAHYGVGLLARLAMTADPAPALGADAERLRRLARFPAGLPPGFTVLEPIGEGGGIGEGGRGHM